MGSRHAPRDQEGEDERPQPIPTVRASEHDPEARPRRQWLIEGLIRRGSLTVVFGPSFIGKSSLLTQLLLAVARGARSVLDDSTVVNCDGVPSPVLFLTAEEDQADVIERVGRQSNGEALPREFFISDAEARSGEPWLRIGGREFAPDLQATIERDGLVAVVLDSVVSLGIGDRSDPDAVYDIWRKLAAVARRTGTAIVIVSHRRKSSTSGDRGRYIDRLIGAQEWTALADAILELSESRPVKETLRYLFRHKIRGAFIENTRVVLELDTTHQLFRVRARDEGGADTAVAPTREAMALLQRVRTMICAQDPAQPIRRNELIARFADTERAAVERLVKRRGGIEGDCRGGRIELVRLEAERGRPYAYRFVASEQHTDANAV